jgi:hypothetical protein
MIYIQEISAEDRDAQRLQRKFTRVGARVVSWQYDLNGKPIANGFLCVKCGQVFYPEAKRQRNRHRCPNACNKHLPLE